MCPAVPLDEHSSQSQINTQRQVNFLGQAQRAAAVPSIKELSNDLVVVVVVESLKRLFSAVKKYEEEEELMSITVEATICPVFVNVVAVGLCTMKTIAVVESLLAIMRAFADFVALVRLPVLTHEWLETPQLN
ncbi:hypothetical protein H9P43_006455 [Blastocladiella emersonii ATCC 22665]|nr:hypothetical protein H9P43_006455 [Blastocladiella emersonii ATCC 22665]